MYPEQSFVQHLCHTTHTQRGMYYQQKNLVDSNLTVRDCNIFFFCFSGALALVSGRGKPGGGGRSDRDLDERTDDYICTHLC